MMRSDMAVQRIVCAGLIGTLGLATATASEHHPPSAGDPPVSELSPRLTPPVSPAPAATPAGAVYPEVIPVEGLRAEAADEAMDEALLERALERSLVLSGGLLLPRGQYEIEPGLAYDYHRRSGLTIVPEGIATRDLRRETYSASLRAALPWTSQMELSVPFGYQDVEDITAGVSTRADGSGIGDVEFVLSTEFFGRRGAPGLIGSLSYQWSTGQSELDSGADSAAPPLSLGAGYDALSAGLTAVQRTDPLVFVGSLSRTFNRSTRASGASIDPDDTDSGSIRAILAASPGVSLRAGFSLSRSGDTTVDGQSAAGSRQSIGILELGGSMVLTPRVLLDVSIGAGLTEESPDFVLGIALPIRSALPSAANRRLAAAQRE